ncbi:HalD/BesD family halogenase [Defluviimonas salinarum]|uniref:2OG-Fe(II) oxygenase n=1 Tax=Defluviimonas salinarum TaxID=2992147 RepID=A0ABT3JA37_9RHOB|nr:2OG-Fe(II) oxygenase [Defluviimonas salinarum]MCW3784557.1 2OG-Fe(II) oxygenase [Defluviimonas salinarum]
MDTMQDIIDLDRYPLDRPESPEWQALVARARADLARDGMFNFEGFLKPEAIGAAVSALVPRFDGESFTHARKHNIYFRKEIPGLAPGHPALREFETVNRTLCGDQIGGVVAALYDWPGFARFLAAAMEKPVLHTMDDPLARVNAMAYGTGEALNWHFDRSEFTTTLLLQAPEAGGEFEYRSDLRSDDDPNYEGVARLLADGDPDLKRLTLAPGTLNVFKGKNTAHRVTPVKGTRARIITVFSFYERPGVRFTEEEQRGFYGRAA